MKTKPTVTAIISTRDQYFTTLPLVIESIISQTYRPTEMVIYDDGEQQDLRGNSLYYNLFKTLDLLGIQWSVAFGEKRGHNRNLEKAIEKSKSDWIWKLGGGHYPEPDALHRLVSNIDDRTGVVGGCFLEPMDSRKCPDWLTNNIDEAHYSPNMQIFLHDSKESKKIDYLEENFIVRKEAAKGIVISDFSPAGNRCNVAFTYEIKKRGFDIIFDSNSICWYMGITENELKDVKKEDYWKHDKKILLEKLKKLEVRPKNGKLFVLNCGIGDHIAFRMILPEIEKKYDDLVIAACYSEVIQDYGIEKIISLSEADKLANYKSEQLNIYCWMINHNWKGKLKDAFLAAALEE